MDNEGEAGTESEESHSGSVVREAFGTLPDGTEADLYRLGNDNGMTMNVTNYGGIITSLCVPDREGTVEDVVLGFDSLEQYLCEQYRADNPHFGALIGRYANRIADGTFTIDGHSYSLATNNGDHHLHGGKEGFDRVLWDATPARRSNGVELALSHTSPDGHEGYPGRLSVTVTYALTTDNRVIVDYRATTTKPTPVNLTQHSYFNLEGHGAGAILDHELMINAETFTPVDASLIPTGEFRSVEGGPFDFSERRPIGARIEADDEQLRYGSGYDHNFVLGRQAADAPRLAARLYEASTGRLLTVRTTEPGLQFYAGNFLDGTFTGKGATYRRRSGLALETQHFPDSPNQPHFPSTILWSGEAYTSRTVYDFTTRAPD